MNMKIEINGYRLHKKLNRTEACILHQFNYWITYNKENRINFKEGRTWTYGNIKYWLDQLDNTISESTFKRATKKLKEMGLITKGCFNSWKNDKTRWYSINYDKLAEIFKEQVAVDNNKYSSVDTVDNEKVVDNTRPYPSAHFKRSGRSETILALPKNKKEIKKDCNTTLKPKGLVVDKKEISSLQKALIKDKTHLLLEKKRQSKKVASWNLDRLKIAIDIFLEKSGEYFTFLEKIYNDDRNFSFSSSQTPAENWAGQMEDNGSNLEVLDESINKSLEVKSVANGNSDKINYTRANSSYRGASYINTHNKFRNFTETYVNDYEADDLDDIIMNANKRKWEECDKSKIK